MPPAEKPRPKPPKPKPKPKPKHKTGPEPNLKPMPARPLPVKPAERNVAPTVGGAPFLRQHHPDFSCATYRLCPPPPPSPQAATVHLRSGRLPTPLIAISASLLALSAVLLIALLVRWLLRRRRQQHAPPQDQEAPLAAGDDDDEESVNAVDTTAWWGQQEEGEEVGSGDGGVHHVWFIRTKGLDERAIAAIAAVVYDSGGNSKQRGAVDGEESGCAVCLAEFRDGETLRLLPRCRHAFHRACIDTWLRAHVNCPLCRAPVQVPNAGEEAKPNRGGVLVGGVRTEEEAAERRRVVPPERAVRRAASMVTLPARRDASVQAAAAASSSAREEDMAVGLVKIRRLLKWTESLDMAGAGEGAGRSTSFGAGRCPQRLPARSSGPSTAATGAGVNGDGEIESSR